MPDESIQIVRERVRECLLSFGGECFVFLVAIQILKIKIYRTIGLSVVWYGCETWALRLRDESRLRVFENRVWRRIFKPKKDEVKGKWRKLHNEELHDLYSSPNIVLMIKSRRMRWVGHVARLGRKEACIGFWWRNMWGRDHLGDPG
jgi:hypothetical protein